jgi:2-keto-4-pentenoate hydratase/2-oxohepta-3-ene-1,7-dioic acid hydratase (catechol pathway)
MKLCTIMREGTPTLGVKTEAGIIDIAAALAAHPNGAVSADIMEVIAGGEAALKALSEYVGHLPLAGNPAYVLDEKAVKWGPCVTRPQKIICIGLNYRKHAEETGSPIPQFPILFSKFNNSLAGHLDEIAVPKVTEQMDYEAELAIVIGKRAKHVAKEKALEHVFGYCNADDLSARDLQMRTPQWLLGKTPDGFAPIGPYLVTADEVGDPNRLEIKAIVNGEVRQHSNTSDMIFYCDEIVSYISRHMTLEPGDIILTGTPEGVILGYPPEKRVWLKPGDTVTIEIEKLGALTNRLVEEK